MTSSNALRPLMLAVASTLLLGPGAQAGPIPTHLSTMKSMVDQTTTEVRWVGGWRRWPMARIRPSAAPGSPPATYSRRPTWRGHRCR